MKYKVGDKVKIKSIEWYKANEFAGRVMCDCQAFLDMMTECCGKELTVDLIYTDNNGKTGYIMKEPEIQWIFTDGMIEYLVDDEPQEKIVSLEDVMAYTFRGLGWLAENIEADMGTTRERALGCIDTLQFLCNDVIMELRNKKIQKSI